MASYCIKYCSGTTCWTSADTANIDIGSYPPTTVHGLQMNTLWDGFFHTITWLAVLIGLGLL